jgi:hypothetical protein
VRRYPGFTLFFGWLITGAIAWFAPTFTVCVVALILTFVLFLTWFGYIGNDVDQFNVSEGIKRSRDG